MDATTTTGKLWRQAVAYMMTGVAIRSALILVALALPVLIAGCGRSPAGVEAEPMSAVVSEQEATAMAENLLAGFNAGDYAVFSRDWSPTLKEGIREPDFMAFRDELTSRSGTFLSIASVALSQAETPGNVNYVFATEFDKGPVTLTLNMKRDGEQIEGVLMESPE